MTCPASVRFDPGPAGDWARAHFRPYRGVPDVLRGACKHVRILEGAGLVTRTRKSRENTLHLTGDPLGDVARWVSRYERFWTERLDVVL
jgi:hypothetical protein